MSWTTPSMWRTGDTIGAGGTNTSDASAFTFSGVSVAGGGGSDNYGGLQPLHQFPYIPEPTITQQPANLPQLMDTEVLKEMIRSLQGLLADDAEAAPLDLQPERKIRIRE